MKYLLVIVVLAATACGPVPPPKNAYTEAFDLLTDFADQRHKVQSFRITGKVDHFGPENRVRGKVYFFGESDDHLRVDLLSPFGSSLSVLTVHQGSFALSDKREGRFLTGPAEACAIARFLAVELPPEDVMSILVGSTPIIEGATLVRWDRDGHYAVEITDGRLVQKLHIGPSRKSLPLLKSSLEDEDGLVWEIDYRVWKSVGELFVPFEIEVKMPRGDAELLVRYDPEGVELNVTLPKDAWELLPPPGIKPEQISCTGH